ncbi:MAG: radical SAM protein [Calditrichaeota bacterium]|nr:radical SAM protein [Calditrichota bacterium]
MAGYGHDLGLNHALLTLLSSLEKVSDLRRVRLGSLEPWGLSKELLERMAGFEIICPHLHLSIQSADDAVLRRMNRRYTAAYLDEMIGYAFSLRADWGLGADVIVGFPGETEEQFSRTQNFLEDHPFAYLHGFSFSLRPGTPAERLPGRVPNAEITRRARLLKEVDTRKRQAFRAKHLGTVQQVIPEDRKKNGLASGHTANYLRVFFDLSPIPPQSLCEVAVEALHPQGVQGRVIRISSYDNEKASAECGSFGSHFSGFGPD